MEDDHRERIRVIKLPPLGNARYSKLLSNIPYHQPSTPISPSVNRYSKLITPSVPRPDIIPSVNHSISPSAHQPISPPAHQPTSSSSHQLISSSAHQLISSSAHQLISSSARRDVPLCHPWLASLSRSNATFLRVNPTYVPPKVCERLCMRARIGKTYAACPIRCDAIPALLPHAQPRCHYHVHGHAHARVHVHVPRSQ